MEHVRTGRSSQRHKTRDGDDRATHNVLAKEIIETVVLTLVIFLVIHFSVQPFRVDGPSMQPGLHTGELVFVNLLNYDFGSPKRGDIIVFHPPGVSDPSVNYVKRVIGVPGDSITVTSTSVYVDGQKLNEPYIYPEPAGQIENPSGLVANLILGPDQYWVMGDHRLDSSDSRVFGPITRSEIVGKADGVMWPVGDIHWFTNYSNVFATVKQ